MLVSESELSRLQQDLANDKSVVAWLQSIQDVVHDRLISKRIPRELALEAGDLLEASDDLTKPVQVSQEKLDRINRLSGASELKGTPRIKSEAQRIVKHYPEIQDLNSVQLSRVLDEVYKKVDTHIESAPTEAPSYPDPDNPNGGLFGASPNSRLIQTNATYRCDFDELNDYNKCRVRTRRDSNAHAVIGYGVTFLLFGGCMIGSGGTLTLACGGILTGGLSSASLWTLHTHSTGYQDCEDDYGNHGCPCKTPHSDFPDEFQDCELDREALHNGTNAPTTPVGGTGGGLGYSPGPLPGGGFQLPVYVGVRGGGGGGGGVVEVGPPVTAGSCRTHYSAADCQAMF